MPGVDSVINAFAAGTQLRRQREQDQQQQEDRKLEQEGLQLRLKAMKLEEKLQARRLATENFSMLQGQPEAQLTEGGVLPATAVPGMGMDATMQTPRKQVTIPGVSELGVDDVTMQPQSMEEILAAKLAAERRAFMSTPREIGGRIVTPGGGPGGKPEVLYEPEKEVKAVTFNAPVVAFVRGKRDYAQRGSDGVWYDMEGAKLPNGAVRPVPEKDSTPTEAGKDDPELPRGVSDFLSSLTRETDAAGQAMTFESARAKVAATWPQLRADHPKLDALKVDTALRNLFRPAPGAGAADVLEALGAAIAAGSGGAATPSGGRPTPPAAARPAPAPKPTATSAAVVEKVGKNTTKIVMQGGVRFKVTTDANGKVVSAVPE